MNKNITKSKQIAMTDEMLDQVSGGFVLDPSALKPVSEDTRKQEQNSMIQNMNLEINNSGGTSGTSVVVGTTGNSGNSGSVSVG